MSKPLNQIKILEAFKNGRFPDCKGKVTHVETIISNVFICDDFVYKIYKAENFPSGDRSKQDVRFSFTKDDFEWNQRLSPEVYFFVQGIRLNNDFAEFCEEDEAEELMIMMKKIDTDYLLMDLLINNSLEEGDIEKIGYQLAEKLSTKEININDSRNWHEIFSDLYRDLEPWVLEVDGYSKDEAVKYLNFIKNFIENNSEDMSTNTNLSFNVDMHSENVIYRDGEIHIFDSCPPKKEWRIQHKDTALYRLATDIYAFSGKENFEAFKKGYTNFTKEDLDKNYENFWIIYSACLRLPYLFTLCKNDPSKVGAAKLYEQFTLDYFNNIK